MQTTTNKYTLGGDDNEDDDDDIEELSTSPRVYVPIESTPEENPGPPTRFSYTLDQCQLRRLVQSHLDHHRETMSFLLLLCIYLFDCGKELLALSDSIADRRYNTLVSFCGLLSDAE